MSLKGNKRNVTEVLSNRAFLTRDKKDDRMEIKIVGERLTIVSSIFV